MKSWKFDNKIGWVLSLKMNYEQIIDVVSWCIYNNISYDYEISMLQKDIIFWVFKTKETALFFEMTWAHDTENND